MANKPDEPNLGDERVRFTLHMSKTASQCVKKWYREANCENQSEFIEKAILFYVGFLSTEGGGDYLPKVLTSTLKSMVAESDNRISRIIFKLAVELAVTMNIVAATNNISRDQIRDLRATCVSEVKRTNGSYSLLDAYEMQRG